MPAMPKTLNEVAHETIGALVLEAAMLRQENALLLARVAELTPTPEPPKDGA